MDVLTTRVVTTLEDTKREVGANNIRGSQVARVSRLKLDKRSPCAPDPSLPSPVPNLAYIPFYSFLYSTWFIIVLTAVSLPGS